MSTNIVPPFPVFTDSTGAPLDNGFVYVGTANLNPVSNPIAVYWDAALTVVAAQPIRTINGYLSQSGSPGTLFSAVDYSITVKDSTGVQVFTAPDSARAGLGSIVLTATESLTASAGSSIILQDGSTMTVGTATGTPVTVTMASNARIVGNVLPNVTGTQSLGSAARRWIVEASALNVGASVLFPAAGGGTVGTDALSLASVVSDDVHATTITAYQDQKEPLTPTDVLRLNQQSVVAACGRVSSANAIGTNHKNITSSTGGGGTGVYDVLLDEAIEDDAVIVATSTAVGTDLQVRSQIITSGTVIRFSCYQGGVLTDMNFSFIAVGRPRGGVANPIL